MRNVLPVPALPMTVMNNGENVVSLFCACRPGNESHSIILFIVAYEILH